MWFKAWVGGGKVNVWGGRRRAQGRGEGEGCSA